MRALWLAFGMALAGHAAAAPQPFHVTYEAPAGCSSRAAFVAELSARTPRARLAAADETAATFDVTLSDRVTDVLGRLTLREIDGRETPRAVAGATCEEVVSALALIAAVLVDPEALSRSEPDHAQRPAPEPRRPARRAHFRFGGGAGAALDSGIAPELALSAFFELDAEHQSATGARGISFGIAAQRTRSDTVDTGAGRADFTYTGARGWFCPLSLPSTGLVSFTPCAALGVGTLRGVGSATLDQQTVTRPWLSLGPLARLELRPTRFLSFTLDGEAVVALSHPTFYFRPDVRGVRRARARLLGPRVAPRRVALSARTAPRAAHRAGSIPLQP